MSVLVKRFSSNLKPKNVITLSKAKRIKPKKVTRPDNIIIKKDEEQIPIVVKPLRFWMV